MVRRMTSRNTITIPKKVLDNVGAGEGAYFEVSDEAGRIILTPKQVEDRYTDEEWDKLGRLLKETGKTYRDASRAKTHVRKLAK